MFPDPGVSAAVVVGGVALVSNWRTQRLAHAAIEAAQNGPMTDRWVSAVKLLAACGTADRPSIESRLGAIYLIEQISRDSKAYRVPGMELIAAYVREHSQMGHTSLEPATDVQSALSVLGRSGHGGLDLRRTVLWGADLEGAHLADVNLTEARMRGAHLMSARMPRGRLRGADLVGADLSGAHLRGANLVGADLSAAKLRGTDLQGADLSGAKLRAADLQGASLVGATLGDADLTAAALDGVDLTGASSKRAATTCTHSWFPTLRRHAPASHPSR
jgi:uncharacterized protein YjbI with pentapeptide repeats